MKKIYIIGNGDVTKRLILPQVIHKFQKIVIVDPAIHEKSKKDNVTLKPLKNFKQELLRFQFDNNIENKDLFIKGIIAAIENKDYRLNRVSQSVIFDETIFFLGLNAGFDTIQFIMDPNLNGFYVFEILDLRLPKEYNLDSLNRTYNFFDENKNYLSSFIEKSISNFIENNIISIRDPLDIYNENKVLKCNISSILKTVCGNKTWDNFYCEDNLSKEFKCD